MFRNHTMKLPMQALRSGAVLLLMFQTVHAGITIPLTRGDHKEIPKEGQTFPGWVINILLHPEGKDDIKTHGGTIRNDKTDYIVTKRDDKGDDETGTTVLTLEMVQASSHPTPGGDFTEGTTCPVVTPGEAPAPEEAPSIETVEMKQMKAAIQQMGHRYYVNTETAKKLEVGQDILGSAILAAKGWQTHPNSHPVDKTFCYIVIDKQNEPSIPGKTVLTLKKQEVAGVGELSEAEQLAQMTAMKSAYDVGNSRNILGKHDILVNEYVNVRVDSRAGQIVSGCGKIKIFGIVQKLPPPIAFDVNGKYEIKILDGPKDLTGTTREFPADKVTRAPKDMVTGTGTEVYFLPTEQIGMQRVFVPSTEEIKLYPKSAVTPRLQDCSAIVGLKKTLNIKDKVFIHDRGYFASCTGNLLGGLLGTDPIHVEVTSVDGLDDEKNELYSYKEVANSANIGQFTRDANGMKYKINTLSDIIKMRRRRVMERLLRYENHYSSGAEGYPPKHPSNC